MEHGTYSKYVSGKCRCDDCKQAAKAYRQSKKGTLSEDDPRHGTQNGYYGFGCRCEPCKGASRDSRKRGLSENDPRHGTVNGYTTWGCRCQPCKDAIATYSRESGSGHRNNLKQAYGMTPEDWEDLFESQNRKCASCGDSPTEDAKRRFHVDHDHDTGVIRGILCHGCNTALGLLKEDHSRIQNLGRYLSEWKPF